MTLTAKSDKTASDICNTLNAREVLTQGFHVLAKPIGPICNLSCQYCFYLEKEILYQNKPATGLNQWAMPENILEAYIRQYIESQPHSTVSFAWQGGEPTLLGIDYFRKIVSLQQKYAQGKRIENALQTNGILIDDAWSEFLAENNFLVGLSVDGPRDLHDCYRTDKGGAPTFDKVMRTIARLKKHGVEFNTLTVVHNQNSRQPLQVYRFLKEAGSRYMQFIPIVERIAVHPPADGLKLISPDSLATAELAPWSVEPIQYARFLCTIFDEWVRNDVGKIFVQLFDVTLAGWVGLEPGLCVFQKTCGSALVIEHNGDVYSCDHYVYRENKLGNILQTPIAALLNSPKQVQFGKAKAEQLPKPCLQCRFLFVCNGECPKHRFVPDAQGREKLNYLCPAYRLFFSHVEPYMEFMAAELRAQRPPANIMDHLRHIGSIGAQIPKPGRNDPCPCGSGLKYKKCCGKNI